MVMEQELDLTQIRTRLAEKNGQKYWKSLEELADTEEMTAFLDQEFPEGASEWSSKFSRRNFLRLMGASMGLAGLTACRPPGQAVERIIPYSIPPEELIPGRPLFFATAMSLGGYAQGALVESHEGRPTKVEGNPDHPDGFGTSNIFQQASILSLYDPDRAQAFSFDGKVSMRQDFQSALSGMLKIQTDSGGAGMRILTRNITSPSLAAQINTVLEKYPAAKWHQYEALNRDNLFDGSQMAFGEAVETRYNFDKADVVLSLDADFFSPGAGNLRYSKDFMARRRVVESSDDFNRLYVVESTPTLAGSVADNRLALRAAQVEHFARDLANALGINVPQANLAGAEAWIKALSSDLAANKGKSLIIAGEHQPPVVHALAHAINDALGNVGKTVIYTEPVAAQPANHTESLKTLTNDINAGDVNFLLILDGNPVYDAPADLNFGAAVESVENSVYYGMYVNESAAASVWHVPGLHSLESWGDLRAFDGTVSLVQPLIEPLFGGIPVFEFLQHVAGESGKTEHDMVKAYWENRFNGLDFNTFWRTSLHNGVVENTAAAEKSVTLTLDALRESPLSPVDESTLEINFRPDPSIGDGEWANNGWLQELPKPLTKLTWDNAALIAPATAEALSLENSDVVSLAYNGATVEAPVWIMPGHPQSSVTVHMGYGRSTAGQVGSSLGFNVNPLRSSDALWFGDGVALTATGNKYKLASTQDHWSLEERDFIRNTTLSEFKKDPEFAQAANEHHQPISLYPEQEYDGNAWGMSIDLGACMGCNACVVACQSENNIPIVGKDQVLNGREMHWIRLDRYYEGEIDEPDTHHQPVICMHCENAPCESVCPVEATVHSHEGLNDMIYNRCVGTRYCANNCPYKVRRFNFFQYSDFEQDPTLSMAANPDVTVRSRGVMEKCTYCVQRINVARISAKKDGREIADGEIVTACQAVCPTQAITFGNINDQNSKVAKEKHSALNYGLLEELNVRPRTTYLAKVRNPNPSLEGKA